MSSAKTGGADAQDDKPATFWQRFKSTVVRTESELSFIKGLSIISIVGTLIAVLPSELIIQIGRYTGRGLASLPLAIQISCLLVTLLFPVDGDHATRPAVLRLRPCPQVGCLDRRQVADQQDCGRALQTL